MYLNPATGLVRIYGGISYRLHSVVVNTLVTCDKYSYKFPGLRHNSSLRSHKLVVPIPVSGIKWEGLRVEPLDKYNMNYNLYVVSALCVFTLILGCVVVSTVTSQQEG